MISTRKMTILYVNTRYFCLPVGQWMSWQRHNSWVSWTFKYFTLIWLWYLLIKWECSLWCIINHLCFSKLFLMTWEHGETAMCNRVHTELNLALCLVSTVPIWYMVSGCLDPAVVGSSFLNWLLHPWDRKLGEPQTQYGQSAKENSIFVLLGLQLLPISCVAHSPFLYWLSYLDYTALRVVVNWPKQ